VGISLILGTFLSYWVMPRGDPCLLALGVTLIFAGVLTNSYAHHCRAGQATTLNRSMSGLGISIASGLLFTCGAPMVAKALASRRPLEPYGICVLFALGSLVAAALLLWGLQRFPMEGERIAYAGYLQGSVRNHAAGLLGGALWGGGMLLTFVPAAIVGMAISSAVGQADPLVAALWGIFVWHEFQGAPVRSQIALAVMFALFLAGLFAIGFCYRSA
jgi:glucose uptake protein